MGADANVFLKFRSVTGTVLKVDIGTSRVEDSVKTSNGLAVLSEDEEVIVYVIAVVEWDMVVCWLGSPNLDGMSIMRDR